VENPIVGAFLAALIGAVIAYLNYRISLLILKKSPQLTAYISIPRQFVNIAYLAAVYFAAPFTPWGLMELLVGAAIGITVPMFVLTGRLIRQLGNENEKDNTGGNKNG